MTYFQTKALRMYSKPTLPGLPVELKERIIKHLGLYDLLALSETSKEFYNLCTHPKLWCEKRTGDNYLWGYDSARVLARLSLDRYRNLIQVTISSRYGYIRPRSDWVELLTALHVLPKLVSLSLEGDLSQAEPWMLADLISTVHCVSLEMCFGVDLAKQEAIINSLACPTSITRHLILKDVDLRQTMHLCKSLVKALKLLWCLEVDDRCLSEKQLNVLNLLRASSGFKCIRNDFRSEEKCKYHTQAREAALRAGFARAWAAAGMDN